MGTPVKKMVLNKDSSILGSKGDVSASLVADHHDIRIDLFKFPPELRNIIYDKILEEGDLTVLLASRKVHQELVAPIALLKTFRVYFGSAWHPPVSVPLGSKATVMVQNLTVTIKRCGLENGRKPRPWKKNLLEYFGGLSQFTRASCTITLDYGEKGWLTHRCVNGMLFTSFKTLTCFRTLTLKMIYEADTPRNEAAARAKGVTSWWHRNKFQI
ncbi:hypothetical protein OEA41_009059 [Lepraria neglecta]|uniref:Uncharacterized protein n=1 Tax=Lepraria neglecta TaxID=209136 RepID=A0AAE0DHP6_9LECA|nr:hypothetical protein OEA41_009059 [Lepraria neglecta]